jgi:putative transcriptional regulator
MKNTGPTDLDVGYLLETPSETDRTLAAWAEQRVAESTPSPELRRRLLQTIAGSGRFGPFVPRLRRLFDLGAQTAADLLAQVDGAADWIEAAPGVRYFHFAPGSSVGQLEAGIVRLRPQATFPRHRHRGPELTLVLEGTLIDRGQAHGAGRVVESATGSEHDYTAGPGRNLILASLHSGIDFV